ncbi:unnamed protein product, partial [Symbiodinium necroappetens]
MAPSPGRLLWDLWWLGTTIWPTWEASRPAAELILGSLGRQHRTPLREAAGQVAAAATAVLVVWLAFERAAGGRATITTSFCPCSASSWGCRKGRFIALSPLADAQDPARARGWANEASMRAHIDAHLAGTLEGDVPAGWMQARGRIRCPVCGLSVSERHGVHPTCRPEARAAAVQTDNMDVDGLALPSFEAIQAGRTRTLRHVPLAARHAWNQVLTRALAAVVHHNSVETWLELLMLPQCVLCAPGRGGRRHRKAAAAFTLDRLQRWQEGERLSLWESRPCCRASRHGPLTPEERRDIATSWGREGFDRKACAALLSKGLCPQTEETARSLAALHPHRPLPAVPAITDLPLAPCMAPELVARCLRAFPAETAPGPSGLRVQHLRDACFAGGTDNFVAQLTAVVELLAQGRAPTAVAPVLAGASLVALPKPAGGVRPIAVGELLHRLTGKCFMATVKDEARAFFWPAQVGVAVKGGSAAAGYCSLPVFGSLGYVVLPPARERALESSAGVQQGDPLGPLLFSLALQPLASELRGGSVDLAVHYLDDGVLAGDIPALGAALQLAQRRAADIGLELNLGKCELVVLSNPRASLLQPHFPDALLQRPDGSSRVLTNNFEFLGAGELLEAVAELEDQQVGLRLLRACAGFSRMVHSMRCNPPCAQATALATFDGLVQRCFGDLTGIHLNAAQWPQAARGVAQAGLGLRSCLTHAPAAYLASLGSSLAACADIDCAFSVAAVRASPSVMGALQAMCRDLPADKSLSLDAALAAKQHDLSERLDNASWQVQLTQASLVEKLCSTPKLASAVGLSLRLSRPGVPDLSQLFSRQSCASGWEFQMPSTTAGVRSVMACWTAIATMRQPASLEESVPFATMPCETCSSLGWTERASIPR